GLGYANIGTVLMQMGVPYDSDEGFAITGAITAIMGGEAYATSAEMASVLGTFERYEENEDHMQRVIRNHRRAIYSVDDSEYEGLSITPMKYRDDLVSEELTEAARKAWDYALQLGEEYGFRNGHVTCLAPTGTTGLLMDCDTTGIEPDFALVKFKKLVGGGYFKIVNQSLRPALKQLGYPANQIEAIVEYTVGAQRLEGAPHVNPSELKALGFTSEQISAIDAVLPSVFDIKFAFSPWVLGEEFLTNKFGIPKEKQQNPEFNLLAELGLNDKQISEANEYVCGVSTIEGAPYLKQEHYAVFDTANKNGEKGTRYISYHGHIKQMAAAQPFLSGAISKTINMPEEASLEDISNAYMDSWKLMIKATALYRDGSKLSQPLSTSSNSDTVYAKLFDFSEEDLDETREIKHINPKAVQEAMYQETQRPYRRHMPDERRSITHKFDVGGHEGYVTVGLYEDGQPGELFITMNKEGSTLSGIVNAWAISISMNLQFGVPLEAIVRKFSHVRFEPSGMTANPEIPVAKSIVDYIARWLGIKFLEQDIAKQYHNEDLVDKAYSENGSNTKIQTEFIKFKEPTEAEQEVVIYQDEQSKEFASYTASKSQNTADFGAQQQQMALRKNNEDAPLCSTCGSVTLRNGACYKCPSCGATTGCS
ncbi:MAG: vitamin B12-dependent ribonucleotide reductase, partial [Candidatus Dojkabacteria bacterium]